MFSAVKKYVLFLKSNETEFGKVNKITQDIGTSGRDEKWLTYCIVRDIVSQKLYNKNV